MNSISPVNLSFDTITPKKESADLSPVLFLHGMTSWRETWKNIAQDIADRTNRKVILLDARNHGNSEWNDNHTYEAMADDVIHFMNERKISKAVLVGHSMGGKTAMLLALKEPSKVEAFIVEDLSPKPIEPHLHERAHKFIDAMRQCLNVIPEQTTIEEAKEIAFEFLYRSTYGQLDTKANMPSSVHRSHGQELGLEKTDSGFRWKANLDSIEKAFFSSATHHTVLSGLYEGPCLFVYGAKSPFNVINDEEYIKNLFPKAAFVGVEGAAHSVHSDFPDEFIKAIVKFL